MIRLPFSHKILFIALALVCFIAPTTGIYSSQAQDKDLSDLSYEELIALLSQYVDTDTTQPKASSEAEEAFDKTLETLKIDGKIPSGNGIKTYWGDYEDEWAQIGWYQWTVFENLNRFVFSANVSWDSGSDKPNNFQSGCGLIFNSGSGNSNHLMASIRMDGLIYFTGMRGYNDLSYGTYSYGKPSIKGNADFVIVVDNDQATIYVDGQRIVQKANLPVMGDEIGLCTLSGTNKDFGTRCTWKDIYVYTW